MAKNPSVKMKKRMLLVIVVLTVIGFTTLVSRLFKLQLVDGEMYQQRALAQQMRSTSITAARGSIYDTNGKILAKSATVWTVYISPAEIKDEETLQKIASKLSELLGVSEETIIERGQNKSSYYEIIKKKVEKEVADQITQFASDENIKGINLEPDIKRYYPYNNLASTVLGFVNDENIGAYGLESYYNDTLSGSDGKVVSIKNAWGTDMPYRYQELYEAQDGNNLVLTIDVTIQQIVERYLEVAVKENNVSNRATAIVMDVETGAILAMATKPDFDPNNPNEITDPLALERLNAIEDKTSEEYKTALLEEQYEQWRNKAISDPYEPGSVFKIITASSALETGVVTMDSNFYCTGSHVVSGTTIRCWKHGGHGAQTFVDAVKNSCNPAFMMIGASLGAENLYNYVDNFGLLEKTNIDLPGEATGIFHSFDTLNKPGGVELASTSFGQTFKVTPIQLLTAVTAAVNDGKLMQPYIVKQVTDVNGNVISTTEPKVVRQVVSEEVSEQIRYILEQVVVSGSGKVAYRPGWRIGGKTGTSEKLDQLDENGQTDAWISSFFGFAPANDPKISVLVLLDEPHVDNVYGSVIAAPVVGNIINEVLPYLGVEPQYTEEEKQDGEVTVPYVLNMESADASSAIIQKGLNFILKGDGGKIIKQLPEAGVSIEKGGTVIIYTDEEETTETVKVPNVIGLSPQRATSVILNSDLNIKIEGIEGESENSVATVQSHDEGEEVLPGTVITVTFSSSSSE